MLHINIDTEKSMFPPAFLMLMLGITYTEGMSACPSDGLPVISTCEGGSMVRSSLLMDFSSAQHSSVSTCHCEVLVLRGKQFHFSQVVAPGYVGCGTEIHVQKIDKPHSGDIIPCYGGTTVSGLGDGSTLRITLMKHSSPFDVHYCYRLDITGDPSAAMSVTCYDEIIQTSQVLTTEGIITISSTNTDDVTTVTRNSTSTSLYKENLSLAPYVHGGTCNKSTLFTASTPRVIKTGTSLPGILKLTILTVIVLLVLFLTAVACYAVIITFKYFTRARNEWASSKLQASSDIYEEIPAGHCLSSPPIYETDTQQRCSTCQNGSTSTMQSNVHSHWNWTYDGQRAPVARSQNPPIPSTYEYEVAKF